MKKILFYYCFILALFISISGIIASQNTVTLMFQLLFIPITLYFAYSVFIQFFDKKNKPITSSVMNRGALFITLVLFVLLLVTSIMRVVKKPQQEVKKSPSISISPNPRAVITPYLMVKSNYQKDIINVRQSPNSTSKIIGVLDTKKKYQIVSRKNQWFEILFENGIKGFVNEKFITNL